MAADPDRTPIDRSTAQHYTWGQVCDGWHLVRDPHLSVIEERMPPGTAETRHVHAAARQFFYVLRGRLTIEAGGKPFALSAGSGLEIPPGVPHQVKNESQEAAEFLVVSQPPSHGDRQPAPEA